MKIHELKTHRPYFDQVFGDTRKSWELRRNDRDFHVGDALHLREFDPVLNGGSYTGPHGFVEITRVTAELPEGLAEGFVILDISPRYLAAFAEVRPGTPSSP